MCIFHLLQHCVLRALNFELPGLNRVSRKCHILDDLFERKNDLDDLYKRKNVQSRYFDRIMILEWKSEAFLKCFQYA